MKDAKFLLRILVGCIIRWKTCIYRHEGHMVIDFHKWKAEQNWKFEIG